jgi:hypothetical protein
MGGLFHLPQAMATTIEQGLVGGVGAYGPTVTGSTPLGLITTGLTGKIQRAAANVAAKQEAAVAAPAPPTAAPVAQQSTMGNEHSFEEQEHPDWYHPMGLQTAPAGSKAFVPPGPGNPSGSTTSSKVPPGAVANDAVGRHGAAVAAARGGTPSRPTNPSSFISMMQSLGTGAAVARQQQSQTMKLAAEHKVSFGGGPSDRPTTITDLLMGVHDPSELMHGPGTFKRLGPPPVPKAATGTGAQPTPQGHFQTANSNGAVPVPATSVTPQPQPQQQQQQQKPGTATPA